MNYRYLTVIFILIMFAISGCVTTPGADGSDPTTVLGFLKKTSRLVKQQRWGQAELLLKRGINQFPEEKSLADKLTKVQTQWSHRKRRLEDWIVVYESENLLGQRPLLVSMTQSDPNDFFLGLRLNRVNSELNDQHKALVDCTEYHLQNELQLAYRCIKAANLINRTIYVQSLLRTIQKQKAGIKKQKASKKKQQLLQKQELAKQQTIQDKVEQRQEQLMLARSHLQGQYYYEAVKILEPLLEQDEIDNEALILIEEAHTGMDLQVLQLISHGDRLYREQSIKAALAVWEKAAVINPEHTAIAMRIDRAKKVLGNLEHLENKAVIQQ